MAEATLRAIHRLNLRWWMRWVLYWHRIRRHEMNYGPGRGAENWWKLRVTCVSCGVDWQAEYEF